MIIAFAHQVPQHGKQSDPRAIFIPVGYKGNLREKNSLFLRTRRFKDYFHVRPSAFRWWKDTRFNQVNATTLHLCSPELRVHTPRVRVHVSVNTDQGDFYERYTLWKRCRRVPTGTSSHRPFLTSTFLADWFEEKCGLNLETVFSIFSKEDFDDCQTTAWRWRFRMCNCFFFLTQLIRWLIGFIDFPYMVLKYQYTSNPWFLRGNVSLRVIK